MRTSQQATLSIDIDVSDDGLCYQVWVTDVKGVQTQYLTGKVEDLSGSKRMKASEIPQGISSSITRTLAPFGP